MPDGVNRYEIVPAQPEPVAAHPHLGSDNPAAEFSAVEWIDDPAPVRRPHERDLLVPAPQDISEATLAEANAAASGAASVPQPRDDLTRIRGIDDVLAKRLAAIGIQRFDQLAAWKPEDVRIIAQALGLGAAFVRQGVVEQAATLSRRAQTAAQKADKADAATVACADGVALPVLGWTPKRTPARAGLVQSLRTPPPSLFPAMRQSILARLRRGPNGLGITPLLAMAPELGQPIFIALDGNANELKPHWTPTPLADVMPPNANTNALPALKLFQTAQLAPPARAHLPIDETPLEAKPTPAPAPLHVRAQQRLDELELEIRSLIRTRAPVPAPLNLARGEAEVSIRPRTAVAIPPVPALAGSAGAIDAEPDAGATAVSVAPVDEAEVTITRAAPRPPSVPFLPSLEPSVLRPSSGVQPSERMAVEGGNEWGLGPLLDWAQAKTPARAGTN